MNSTPLLPNISAIAQKATEINNACVCPLTTLQPLDNSQSIVVNTQMLSSLKAEVLLSANNSRIYVIKNYCSTNLYDFLNTLPFQIKPPIKLPFGGGVGHQNRDIIFYSDESEGYRYSGQMMPSVPLAGNAQGEFLLTLMRHVNSTLGTNFNGILINRYNSGQDHIGAHGDNERSLDKKTKAVASLSFGAERKFRIRNKETKEIVMDIKTEQGMLLVMDGDTQLHYTHEIPVEKRIKEGRISVTFRHHLE